MIRAVLSEAAALVAISLFVAAVLSAAAIAQSLIGLG